MAASPPEVRVGPRGAARIRALHPWVFRADVSVPGDAGHGDVVRVRGAAGEPLGHAFYSRSSKIALRMVSTGETPPDAAFWEDRVEAALAYRRTVVSGTDAFRVLFGESDGIPGLVADRYGTHLIVQVLTAGAARVLDSILDAVAARLPVDSVLARNDPAVRRLEDLPREVTQLRGHTPATIDTHEGPVRFRIDPWKGQKTGAFLDQRENRLAAAAYARGRVLDAFAYHGSFAMHAAAGAASVVIVDASADALARAQLHVEMNQAHDVTLCEANVFDDLRHRVRRGETFDTIFLDPPAFAKSRADLDAARRGYKEIHVRALQLLAPGGTLVTSSCSYNLLEPDWIQVVTSAAQDVHRAARVTEKRGQARDHPVRLGFPESHYLKCLTLNCP